MFIIINRIANTVDYLCTVFNVVFCSEINDLCIVFYVEFNYDVLDGTV